MADVMEAAKLAERERVVRRCEYLARYRGDLVTAADIRREFNLKEER